MGEPIKRQDDNLANIKLIQSFAGAKQSLLKTLEAQKAKLESSMRELESKKDAINKDIQDKLEKQQAKERLEKEREDEIRISLSTPIIPASTNNAEEPKEIKKEVVAPESTIEPEKEIIKAKDLQEEDKVEAEKSAKEAVETKESKEAEQLRKKKERENAILSSILVTKPKPAPEKPVIKIYIPPVEQQRGPRRPRENNNAVGSGYQPRPNGNKNQSSSSFRTQTANLASLPVLPSKDNKKKNDKSNYKPTQLDDNKVLSKKAKARKGVEGSFTALEYDEISGEITKIRSRKSGSDKKKAQFVMPTQVTIDHAVINDENLTIKTLSEKIGKTGVEIIKQLFLLGIIKTINDPIDFETAELVSSVLGVTIELQHTETSEEKIFALHGDEDAEETLKPRPPIVTIMGHVDHGKTSILDYIRKANVASGEAGGITQHIGAYSIVVDNQQITFLDTPGHAAFTAMRARGADVTDIVIIVVAADDGIMPQTIEAINHAKAANVSIIVAINKMDRSGADPDRVLTQLTEQGIVPEEWGGTVPVVRVSAKTGMGMQDLLNTILITAEVMELKANPDRAAKGTIVEAKLDKGKGPMATVLVQNGTLLLGDFIVAGSVTGKIRAMQDDKGRPVKKAGPSTPVSILGLQEVPYAGDQLLVVSDEKLMKQVAEERHNKEKRNRVKAASVNLDDVFKGIEDGKLKNLNIILKADVQGSVEAIKESLIKLSNEEVKVSVVHAVAGAINESDVMLADTTHSIIIGFNVRPDSNARALAEKNNIDIRLYRVIYDAIDDVNKAIKGLLAPKFREQYLGRAEVRQIYKISGVGTIAGCMVKDGKIVRNAKVRLLRDNVVITETLISSLKRMKDDAKEVVAGFECGIGLDNYNDIKEGDVIESFSLVQEEI